MTLSDLMAKGAKPKEKRYMLADGEGLYLEVMPTGKKFWRYRAWEKTREVKKTIGQYPAVGLREAREKRDEFKEKQAAGISLKEILNPKPVITFEIVGREWFERQIKSTKSQGHAETVISRLERFLFPAFGSKPINEITAKELLELLRTLEDRGIVETAHRVKQIAGQVFRYGIAIGECDRDISGDLRGALQPNIHKNHATMTNEKDITDLLRAMAAFDGGLIVESALWFSAYTFCRPGEVRLAEWTEVDLDNKEWRIPAEKMKLRRQHIVPLAEQVINILLRLKTHTGHGRYIFPSNRTLTKGDRPMSENAITAALRRLGYTGEQMTAHGFRGMASTRLNELGWSSDAIERQLAHVEKSSVRAAYNHAEYLPERRKMMAFWADYLDGLIKA